VPDLHDLDRRVDGVENARTAGAAMIATDDQQQRMLAAMRVAHLGGCALGAGEAAREQQVGNAHAIMIAGWSRAR